MRLKNIPGSCEEVTESAYAVTAPREFRGRWQSLFPTAQSLHLEIGMGKGAFLTGMAQAHPNVNYLGIEKYSSVLVKAVRKQGEKKLPNLFLILADAENLTEIFAEDEVDRIYLNFPDPWPKARHAGRRLTSGKYLDRYGIIMKEDGQLECKTDNRALFDYSVDSLRASGWTLTAATGDLHDSPLAEGNIMTEYEEKFSAAGNPICKLIAVPKKMNADEEGKIHGIDNNGREL